MKKLKEKLGAKLSKNGGFTLVEMLIVVAIIAILVAVSIPLVNTSLEKAKEATDDANMRAAKAEATLMYMNHEIDATMPELEQNMKYDNVKGKFVASTETVAGYNKMEKGSKKADTTWIYVKSITTTPGSDVMFELDWSTT